MRFRRLIPSPQSDVGHKLWLYGATPEKLNEWRLTTHRRPWPNEGLISPRDQSRWFAPIAARPNKVNDQTLPIRGALLAIRLVMSTSFGTRIIIQSQRSRGCFLPTRCWDRRKSRFLV